MKDWKDLKDPREKFPPAGTQTGETSPRIVKTKYETKDIIVADIVPAEMGYAVDPTGAADSTDGIQQALYDCYYSGGGTVFLPAGNYAITDTIVIPQGVTLRGIGRIRTSEPNTAPYSAFGWIQARKIQAEPLLFTIRRE